MYLFITKNSGHKVYGDPVNLIWSSVYQEVYAVFETATRRLVRRI